MDAINCIKGRRSIRAYNEKDIPVSVLKEIVEIASFAPSWKNSQTASYIAVKNPELKQQIADQAMMGFGPNQTRVTECNTLVAVITRRGVSGYNPDGNPTTSLGTHWQSFDAGIATQTFCLAAYSKNVGSLIMGIYDESRVAQLLNVDLSIYTVSALVALGYTDADPQAPKRKSCDELLSVMQ
jgi:nitroreductase